MSPSFIEIVLELEAGLIVGAIALGWFIATQKLPVALSTKLQQPAVALALMLGLIIPVFIGVLFLHRFNEDISNGLLIILAIALPLLFKNMIAKLRAKSALAIAHTETMLEQLAEGPGIKHPELDHAILTSRLTLARAKEQINNGSIRSNRRLFFEAITAAGIIVIMHSIFVIFNGATIAETLVLSDILFRFTFITATVFLFNKLSDGAKAKTRAITQDRNLNGPG